MAYILLVDDDREILELLEILLVDEGYQVGTATNARDALQMIEMRDPDVILFDLWMPGQSGESFVEAFRGVETANAALVLLSAFADLEQIAHELQIDGYIEKPFNVSTLLSMLSDLLIRRAER